MNQFVADPQWGLAGSSVFPHFSAARCSLEKTETQLSSYVLWPAELQPLVSTVRTHAHPFPVIPERERFQRKKVQAASTLSQPNSFLLQLGIDSTTFIPWISSFNFSATEFNNHPSDKIVKSLHLRLWDEWCEWVVRQTAVSYSMFRISYSDFSFAHSYPFTKQWSNSCFNWGSLVILPMLFAKIKKRTSISNETQSYPFISKIVTKKAILAGIQYTFIQMYRRKSGLLLKGWPKHLSNFLLWNMRISVLQCDLELNVIPFSCCIHLVIWQQLRKIRYIKNLKGNLLLIHKSI